MSKLYTIGVDLGGTHTAIGLVNSEGEIVARDKMSTCGHADFEAYADELGERIKALAAKAEGEINGIGVGAPCVDSTSGIIDGAVDLPWPSPIHLAKAINDRTGLAVKTGNDANAAALGEYAYGAAKGVKNFIMLTLGTGIGAGIVADGHLIEGHRGMGGELGHTIIRRGGRDCMCGRKGCLETYCSARGLVRTAREMLETRDTPSSLRDYDIEKLTARDVYDEAVKGDALAKEIFDFTGQILGEACADFAAINSPEMFVFFGGLAQAGEMLLAPVRKAIAEHILHIYKDQVQVAVSSLPNDDAALLGAAALAV